MTAVVRAEARESTASVSKERFAGRIPVIKSRDIGLKVWRDPQDADVIDVDIVAVHGIGVHPNETWCHRNGVNWLSHKDMLPKALPNARIMAFGYDSVWYGDTANRQSLSSVAAKLLSALKRERTKCPTRPIIFIGHCFGGLVMQEAYNASSSNTHDYPHIAGSIAGMVFLGTPHYGVPNSSGLASQGEVYAAIVESGMHIEDNVLQTMAHNNDLLVDAVHKFTRAVNVRKPAPKLFCFYEQKATKVGLIAGMNTRPEFVVNESAGTLSGHEKESLPLDHFHMNKFEDREDNNYQCVSDQIIKMAAEALQRAEAETETAGTLKRALSRSVARRDIPKFSAPIKQETHFASRDDILKKIETKFELGEEVALHGPMGSGKTHVAVEYAHSYHKENRGSKVYWVNANTPEQFELSYKQIAENLRLGKENSGNGGYLQAILQYLKKQSSGSWLMVLDGLDNESSLLATDPANAGQSLLKFLPSGIDGRKLITTRSKPTAMKLVNKKPEYIVSVGSLSSEDASNVLFGRVTREEARKKWVTQVSQKLNDSAGALAMALTYRKRAGKEIAHKDLLEMPESKDKSSSGMEHVVQLLHNLLGKKEHDSVDLMHLVCSLDVQCIPRSFFDKSQVSTLTRILEKYGFVEPSQDGQVFSVTPAVRDCIRAWLAKHDDQRQSIEGLALHNLSVKFKDDYAEDLLPCALAVLKFKPASTEERQTLAMLMFQVGRYYISVKQGRMALVRLEECLSLREADKDLQNKETLIAETKKSIQEAKDLLSKQGDVQGLTAGNTLSEAPKQSQELEIRKVSAAAALSMRQQNKDGSSDPVALYQQVLEWCRTARGTSHIDTARNHYNLALAHDRNGNYDEAEDLYRSALHLLQTQDTQENAGPEPKKLALRVLSSLARMYEEQGRLDEAEEAFRAALPGQAAILGQYHPETLGTRHNFALLLQDRNNLDAAGNELADILGAQLRLLEENDPATLRTARSMALNFRLQSKLDNSEQMYGAVYNAQKKTLGKTHGDTVMTKVMLDELLQEKTSLSTA